MEIVGTHYDLSHLNGPVAAQMSECPPVTTERLVGTCVRFIRVIAEASGPMRIAVR
jgi:hypothetical protein